MAYVSRLDGNEIISSATALLFALLLGATFILYPLQVGDLWPLTFLYPLQVVLLKNVSPLQLPLQVAPKSSIGSRSACS